MTRVEEQREQIANRLGEPDRLQFPSEWTLSSSWRRAQAAPSTVGAVNAAEFDVLLGYVDDYDHAVITAILGAIGWALTGWIPLIGPLVALVVWVRVIKWRYPGGWVRAVITGGVAWIAALTILLAVNSVLGTGIGAFGIPGV